jgi:hypothetical protein
MANKTGTGEKRMSVSESADEYAEAIVNKFIEEITDQVFLYIENSDDLMREYMSNVNRHGLLNVNTSIGEKVRELLDLDNDGENN